MASYKSVTVLAASGNLGPWVIKALLKSGFKVSALTRQDSKATFSSNVDVKRVDISSRSSIAEALKGQDAVVSTLPGEAIAAQRIFIDAAIDAGVKRFVPSEFGINTREARGTKFEPFVATKIADVDYLIKLSEKYSWFSWSAISTGAFFDWGLDNGFFGFDLKNKTYAVFDSGNEKFSGTNFPFIGKCVAASLVKAEETTDKFMTVASFTTTQTEVMKIIEEESGAKFFATNVETTNLEKIGDEKAAKGDPIAFVELLLWYVFRDGANQAVEENAAVTVLGLEEEDIRTTTKEALSRSL